MAEPAEKVYAYTGWCAAGALGRPRDNANLRTWRATQRYQQSRHTSLCSARSKAIDCGRSGLVFDKRGTLAGLGGKNIGVKRRNEFPNGHIISPIRVSLLLKERVYLLRPLPGGSELSLEFDDPFRRCFF